MNKENKVEEVLSGFCKRTWGYNWVLGADGKQYELRQKPQESWAIGDVIPASAKEI